MSNPSTDPIETVVRAMPLLFRSLRNSVADHGVAELTNAQSKVLLHLKHAGPSPIGEIAAGVGVTIATASEAVERLVTEGWVHRETNPDNRRQVIAELTPKAFEVAERIHERRSEQVTRALTGFDDAQVDAIVRGLQALIREFEATSAMVSDAGRVRTSSSPEKAQ